MTSREIAVKYYNSIVENKDRSFSAKFKTVKQHEKDINQFAKEAPKEEAQKQLKLVRGKLYSIHKRAGQKIDIWKVIELINEQILKL